VTDEKDFFTPFHNSMSIAISAVYDSAFNEVIHFF
jgi:hypothetical protein